MTTKQIRQTPRRRSGPPSVYHGKIRDRVITFTMSPEGHAALERLLRARDVSRADLLEGLIREAAGK